MLLAWQVSGHRHDLIFGSLFLSLSSGLPYIVYGGRVC